MEKMYKAPEAAECLRVSKSTVYELMKAGKLPHLTIGRRRIIPESCLQRYIADNLTDARLQS